jgi:transcriptional regulator
MYLPAHHTLEDQALALEVMRAHPFAILVSNDADAPFATHAPLAADVRDGKITLHGHIAQANPHRALLDLSPEVLVIFSGPHGYVSPSNYESREMVPTWNYIAVHAYGAVRPRATHESKDAVLKRLIADHDADYAPQWRGLSEAYQTKMLAGIFAFDIEVSRLESKFKVSQNRSAIDRARVAATHAKGNADEQGLARWMQRLGLVT